VRKRIFDSRIRTYTEYNGELRSKIDGCQFNEGTASKPSGLKMNYSERRKIQEWKVSTW